MPRTPNSPPAGTPLIRRETDYAFRAMLHLTCRSGPVSARELAGAQGVPADFAQKILRRLARAGLIVARRGPGGGFCLGPDGARGVTMMDVLTAIQGRPRVNHCIDAPRGCTRRKRCPVHARLERLQACLDEFLTSNRFTDIAPPGRKKKAARERPCTCSRT